MGDSGDMNRAAFLYYRRLRKVEQFVQEHFTENISAGRVAQVAGLERNYFSAFFHEKTGVTFTFWLNELRVSKAQDLMKANNMPIAEIAFAVGYADLRTFERAFKRHMEMTPREFRDSVRPS